MRLANSSFVLVASLIVAWIATSAAPPALQDCPKSCPAATPTDTSPGATTCFTLTKIPQGRHDGTAKLDPTCTTCTECQQTVKYVLSSSTCPYCVVGWTFTHDGATSFGTGGVHLTADLHRRCDAPSTASCNVYAECKDPATGHLSEFTSAAHSLQCGDCQ